MYNKDYFNGKNSNYRFGYESLKSEFVWKYRIKIVRKYKKKGKILDIGCALGYFLMYMKKYGYDVYGIDISNYAINKCRELMKNKTNFFKFNIENSCPFPKNTFDVISMFDVLEHIRNYKKALKNALSMLKKDGLLILSTPLKNRSILNYLVIEKDKTHVSILEERELIKLLNSRNMKILDKVYNISMFGFVLPFIFRKTGTNIIVTSKKIR